MSIARASAPHFREISAPTAFLAFALLAMELFDPGIVGRWFSFPLFFFLLLLCSYASLFLTKNRPSPKSSVGHKLVMTLPALAVGAFAAVTADSVAGPGWRFLVFVFLATVIIALSLVRVNSEEQGE